MENKKIMYILIAVLIVIIVGVEIYQKSIGSNKNLIKSDNLILNQQYISGLYSIANNKTLANNIGISLYSNQGYTSISNKSPLIVNNKPALVYVGADYCPYCAITRWSLILALMRFGNFSNLHYMTSSASDIYSSTPTFTFYNSSYNSNIISFLDVETNTNRINPSTNYYYKLETTNKIENDTLFAYNFHQAIPFLDFGNKSVQVGAIVSPKIIKGMDWNRILEDMKNPNSVVSQSLIGGANLFTVRICEITNNTPKKVCDQQYVANYEKIG